MCKNKFRNTVIGIALLLFLAGIIWLFQTHSPTEKIYTSDRQYSYYLEAFNYSILLKETPFHETEYKVFIYDEIKKKKLCSRYAGGHTAIRDCFGFDEENGLFHFSKPDYYELPRPIDEEAIRQTRIRNDAIYLAHQEKQAIMEKERQEKAVRDTICWKHAKETFYNLPTILPEKLEKIQPVIKRWTEYHKIDLSQAKLFNISGDMVNETPYKGICYREFTAGEDTPSRIEVSYSPDKQRYIDVGVSYKTVNGKHYQISRHVSEIYLIDRKKKHQNCLSCGGSYSPIEKLHDVFWMNNDVFIIVGMNKSYHRLNLSCVDNIIDLEIMQCRYAVYIFDLSANKVTEYGLIVENAHMDADLYFDEYLKEREIIPMKK